MTSKLAGLLGSLSAELLATYTLAQLQALADRLEDSADDNGFMTLGDEADLLLVNKEMERRDEEPTPEPDGPAPAAGGWYLATCRPRSYSSSTLMHGPVMALIQAKDGAEVEDTLRRHDLDGGEVSWEPLDGLRYGVLLGELRVIPRDGGR